MSNTVGNRFRLTIFGQSHAAAVEVPNSYMSDCIPMSPGRMRPGSPNQNQPKLIRVKSSRIIGASLSCHFLSSSLNTFGSNTSKAFAPESMCQPK